jgi:hypothetical protein
MSKRRRRHDASRVVASYRHAASYGDRVLRGGKARRPVVQAPSNCPPGAVNVSRPAAILKSTLLGAVGGRRA